MANAKTAPSPRIKGTYEILLGPKDAILFETGNFCVIRRPPSNQKWPQRPDMRETIYWLASKLDDNKVLLLEGVAPRRRWQSARTELIEKCRSVAKMAEGSQ